MEFRTLVAGPLETNCYILWCESTRKAAIIDPGGARDRIASLVESQGLEVEWILLTHGHPDHAFYAGHLARRFGSRIGMHEADVRHLTEGLSLAELFYDVSEYVEFSPTDLLSDGDVVQFGDSRLQVIHTPGHSEGGLCYAIGADVFCGDTVFAGSVGRTDFPGGSYEQLIRSIREKILTLDDDTRLHPGHGPATTVGAERLHNQFLQPR